MYEFRLTLDLPDGRRVCSAFQVPHMMARHLRPIHLCTDNLTAMVLSEQTIQEAQRLKHDREGLVRDISRQITVAILKALEEQDMVNGYPQGSQFKGDRAKLNGGEL